MATFALLRLGWRDVAHAGLAFVVSVVVTTPFTRIPFAQVGACAAGSVGFLFGLSAFRHLWRQPSVRSYQPNATTVSLTPLVLTEYAPPGWLAVGGALLENTSIEQYRPGEPTRYGFTAYLTEAQIRGIQAAEAMRCCKHQRLECPYSMRMRRDD